MTKKLRGHAAVLCGSELLDIYGELRYPHDTIARLAYLSGSRIGEVLPLGSGSVVGNYLLIYQEKTKRPKSVPISYSLRELIKELPVGDRWFPGRSGGHLCYMAFNKELQRAVQLLGWNGRGIRTHSFRRSRATHLDAAGVPHKAIMLLTGHSSLSSFELYLDTSHAELGEYLAKIDG
jgi:integrase